MTVLRGERAEVIVIGLGAVGAATLYQLARSGVRAWGFDRHSPPHDLGSSHGETRVTRCGVGEGRAYAPFVRRSHDIWRELEQSTGLDLFLACGTLMVASGSGGGSIHGKADFLDRTIAVATDFGVDHEVLSSREIASRYPQLLLSGDERGYYESGAGVLYPELCIAAQLAEAERLGARVFRNQHVRSVAQRANRIEVSTIDAEYTADFGVVAAGAWSPGLVGGDLQVMRLEPQTLHWFECAEPRLYSPDRFPTFMWIHGDQPEDAFYGFPLLPNTSTGGIKVATERRDVVASPGDLPRSSPPDAAAAMFRRHVEGRLAFVGPRALRSATCLYTTSPDGDFAIGRLEDQPRLLVASACSGHGFKHSAAIGELLAKVVVGGDDRLIPEAFALSRLGRGMPEIGASLDVV